MSMGDLTELDVMFTMRPKPLAAMPSTVALISSMGVSMLASKALSQASRSQLRKSPGGGPPALVTTMSKSLPGPPGTENKAARPASVVMSAATGSNFTPGASFCKSATAWFKTSAPRATMTTLTPSKASARAQPQPKPLLAPPTKAHLP